MMSVDSLLAEHVRWLESLQEKRREHLELLTAVIATKQLEIDNLKQIASAKQSDA